MHSLRDTNSPKPNVDHNGLERHESEAEHPERSYGPPPADFATYYSQPPTNGNTPGPGPYLPSPADQSTRKRSLSVFEDQQDRLRDTGQGERSLLDLAQRASLEVAIDPSLAGAPVVGAGGARQTKAKRKEELDKQVEKLRAMLMAVETEFARIADEEQGHG